jgi:hypothetical protein
LAAQGFSLSWLTHTDNFFKHTGIVKKKRLLSHHPMFSCLEFNTIDYERRRIPLAKYKLSEVFIIFV